MPEGVPPEIPSFFEWLGNYAQVEVVSKEHAYVEVRDPYVQYLLAWHFREIAQYIARKHPPADAEETPAHASYNTLLALQHRQDLKRIRDGLPNLKERPLRLLFASSVGKRRYAQQEALKIHLNSQGRFEGEQMWWRIDLSKEYLEEPWVVLMTQMFLSLSGFLTEVEFSSPIMQGFADLAGLHASQIAGYDSYVGQVGLPLNCHALLPALGRPQWRPCDRAINESRIVVECKGARGREAELQVSNYAATAKVFEAAYVSRPGGGYSSSEVGLITFNGNRWNVNPDPKRNFLGKKLSPIDTGTRLSEPHKDWLRDHFEAEIVGEEIQEKSVAWLLDKSATSPERTLHDFLAACDRLRLSTFLSR